MRTCRDAMIEIGRETKINGPVYRAAADVAATIDALTTLLTGDTSYFATPLAVSGGGVSAEEERKRAWEAGDSEQDMPR